MGWDNWYVVSKLGIPKFWEWSTSTLLRLTDELEARSWSIQIDFNSNWLVHMDRHRNPNLAYNIMPRIQFTIQQEHSQYKLIELESPTFTMIFTDLMEPLDNCSISFPVVTSLKTSAWFEHIPLVAVNLSTKPWMNGNPPTVCPPFILILKCLPKQLDFVTTYPSTSLLSKNVKQFEQQNDAQSQ
jgi:hypothetical protein